MAPIYVDLAGGNDETGSGDQNTPYQTLAQALFKHGEGADLQVRKDETEPYDKPTQSSLKKAKKDAQGKAKKAQKALGNKEKAASVAKEKAAIELTEDSSLPAAVKAKINRLTPLRSKRVRVSGWVHRLRSQKGLIFMVVRDGTGYLQAVLAGKLSQAYDAPTLPVETSVELVGTLQAVPEGKTAPGGHELAVDYWKVIGSAPGGDDAFTTLFNESTKPDVLNDIRHLVLRSETASSVLRLRSMLLSSFRQSYAEHNVLEVTPPCLVQTSVEGGATLFKLDYYGQNAYLTQSSQLYLETCLPSLGDVFCVQESFRAEKSLTRRHLSEFTHLEAELAFINFDDLMTHIEAILCDTVDKLLANPISKELISTLNENYKAPSRPFMRLSYVDAIKWLNEHGIQHAKEDAEGNPIKDEDGNEIMVDHVIGDDIAEAAERRMVDTINRPIFLYGFPVEIKPFYMKKMAGSTEGGQVFTESCDLLMPNVGEVVGGSMRISDMDELMAGYKREGIDPAPYYWFSDQRKYGTCEHGGYGLGVERFLAWIANRYTVRECSLYPRWCGRATP